MLDPASGKVSTFAAGFHEPGGFSIAGNTLFRRRHEHHAIRTVDLGTREGGTLTIQGLTPPPTWSYLRRHEPQKDPPITRSTARAIARRNGLQAQAPPTESGTLLVSLIDRPVGRENLFDPPGRRWPRFTGDLDLTERGGGFRFRRPCARAPT
jgi:hypothetical protein